MSPFADLYSQAEIFQHAKFRGTEVQFNTSISFIPQGESFRKQYQLFVTFIEA